MIRGPPSTLLLMTWVTSHLSLNVVVFVWFSIFKLKVGMGQMTDRRMGVMCNAAC